MSSWCCGTWNGLQLCANPGDGPPQSLCWSLAIRPGQENSNFPVFGASRTGDTVRLLKGRYLGVRGEGGVVAQPHFTLSESGTSNQYSCMLTVVPAKAIAEIRGNWTSDYGSGAFVLALVEENSSVHVSGLFVGEAAPAPELRDFYFPTNPITWCCSIILAERVLFGAGLFVDSGDVAGNPELYFTLQGTAAPCEASQDSGAVQLTFDKLYDIESETRVSYTGILTDEVSGDGQVRCICRGVWNNAAAGSRGSYFAARADCSLADSTERQLVLCSCCSRVVADGDTRWACRECEVIDEPWFCCSDCRISDSAFAHAHYNSLLPAVEYRCPCASGDSCSKLIESAINTFSNRPFIRTVEGTLTYQQAGAAVHAASRALLALRLPLRSKVVVLGNITTELTIITLAVTRAGHVIVPLHASMGCSALDSLFLHLAPAAVWAAHDCSHLVPQDWQQRMQELRSLLADSPINSFINSRIPAQTRLHHAHAIHLTVAQSPAPALNLLPLPPALPHDPVAILFTSGSTGVPKAAVFTEDLALPTEGLANIHPFIRLDFQPYDPVYLLSLLSTMQCGGSRALARMPFLYNDCSILRPTHIGATPIFWNGLHSEALRLGGKAAGAASARKLLGNRLAVATSGGAELSPATSQFVRKELKLDLVELYGTRETGGICRNGKIYDGVEVVLSSLPHLGFHSDGVPPRGEICVSSPRLISGYLSFSSIDDDSFFVSNGKRYYRTGDVGEFVDEGADAAITSSPDDRKIVSRCRTLRILGRACDHFKGPSGEWIEPSAIEQVLELCPAVQSAFVWGGGVASQSLTAVCLLDPSIASSSEPAPLDGDDDSLLLSSIRYLCMKHRLRPHQTPQRIFFDRSGEAWSEANGLLTGTQKKKRSALRTKYTPLLVSVSSSTNTSLTGSSAVLDDDENVRSFFCALERVIPGSMNAAASAANSTFSQLGGDSLSAALLVRALPGLDFSTLFEYPLGMVAASYKLTASSSARSFADSNIVEDRWEEHADPGLDLLNGPFLDSASTPSMHSGCVLLTGATGFMGPHMVVALLASFPPPAKIFCIVRGSNDSQARTRLFKCLSDSGINVTSEGADRIRVMSGDCSVSPFLGLSIEAYKTLSTSVHAIVHSAAHVSMTLPFAALCTTNVGGTRNIARLALQCRGGLGASVTLVSTIGAAPVAQTTGRAPEGWGSSRADYCADVLRARGGYGATKAVSERLLLHLHRRRGLDVRCVRPSAVCGHRTTGCSNCNDFGLLIARACRELAAIPSPAPGGSVGLRWIPVDFVASATAAVAAAPSAFFAGEDCRVFNLFGGGPSMGQMLTAICGGQGISVVSAMEWKCMLDAAVIAHKLSASVTALCPILANMPFDSSLEGLELKGQERQSKYDAGSPSRNLAMLQSGFPALEWPHPLQQVLDHNSSIDF